jgi:hypothetical protein
MPSFLVSFNAQGRNSRQSSEVAESLFGHLTLRAALPSWEWNLERYPFPTEPKPQAEKDPIRN